MSFNVFYMFLNKTFCGYVVAYQQNSVNCHLWSRTFWRYHLLVWIGCWTLCVNNTCNIASISPFSLYVHSVCYCISHSLLLHRVKQEFRVQTVRWELQGSQASQEHPGLPLPLRSCFEWAECRRTFVYAYVHTHRWLCGLFCLYCRSYVSRLSSLVTRLCK